jgi:hypothetical protein
MNDVISRHFLTCKLTVQVNPVDVWLGTKIPILQLYDNFCGDWIWEYPVPVWVRHFILKRVK